MGETKDIVGESLIKIHISKQIIYMIGYIVYIQELNVPLLLFFDTHGTSKLIKGA